MMVVIIMITVQPVTDEDIFIILGMNHGEVGMRVLVERFIITVIPVLQQKQVLMLPQHRTIKMHDAQQNMQRPLLLVVVPEVHINGMDIIIFFVPFAEE